ncbi:SDR family oxidoreductase [Faecalicatena orotica]|uniref:Nucleoside-diphosphate-sugar epimerase n=1 Tax=Faecalicatena orotica TaxID=1544 RepID=A0A2Y9BEL5_9FIRM|nr:NAD-dependent epimerase/dehydratase family protein [Faecalicatena orotica]PWJ28908.1 nucleoside-diphosphate-sugar epimerase [Faecalicatena orotica]SSA56077.1 Nucleoside-diphosphate-sugar epimerase [Faecalicatena orotica]
MKKVLIVGGTGTISEPVAKMLAKDKEVELYLLTRTGASNGLPNTVKYIKADIKANPDDVKEQIKDMSFDSVIDFIIMNLEDARNSTDIFKNHTRQFILISTVDALDHRFNCLVDESMPYGNQYYDYGQNKEAVEKYFLDECKRGFPVTIVRPTQTYSKNRIPLSIKGKSCWSVVERMLQGKEVIIHGDGQGLWASTHAEDFAPLFCPLVGRKEAIGEIFQVMNPEPMTWDMIYQNLADLLGVEYKPVYISTYLLDESKVYGWKGSIHGDKHFSCLFDISKAKQFCPEYSPKIDIRTGLKMFLDYMDENPQLKVTDPQFDEWCDKTIARYKECMGEFIKDI